MNKKVLALAIASALALLHQTPRGRSIRPAEQGVRDWVTL